jgi:hypothetical protein
MDYRYRTTPAGSLEPAGVVLFLQFVYYVLDFVPYTFLLYLQCFCNPFEYFQTV